MRFMCLWVCLSAYNMGMGRGDCLQIFRVAPGHPRDYFRHKNLAVMSTETENLHFLFPAAPA